VRQSKKKKEILDRRATFVSDAMNAERTDKEILRELFGITPSIEELKVRYPNMPFKEALLTLEFGIVLTFMLFCFSTSSMMFSQLDTVQGLVAPGKT
jgi:hypothetical protein